jgi:hypothetical protein
VWKRRVLVRIGGTLVILAVGLGWVFNLTPEPGSLLAVHGVTPLVVMVVLVSILIGFVVPIMGKSVIFPHYHEKKDKSNKYGKKYGSELR